MKAAASLRFQTAGAFPRDHAFDRCDKGKDFENSADVAPGEDREGGR